MPNLGDQTIIRISVILILLVFQVGAQGMSGSTPPEYKQYASFTPSMAVIIVVLIAAFFFMGFFSIYIRHCSDTSSVAAVRGLGASLRRRTAPRGLDSSILETFPTFGYSEVKNMKIGKGALECAVCLNEFEEEDTLRLIPRCDHVFHPECIDAWLESHVTCPVCRANLADPAEPEPDHRTNEPAAAAGEVSIRIVEANHDEATSQEPVDGTQSMNEVCPPRSRSVRTKVWPKFARSHTTGHSLVQPGKNLDRFTLRLPKDFRIKVMDRTSSCMVALPPMEGSSGKGYRTGEGSTRGGWSFKRVDPVAKSDRWVFPMSLPFFSRGFSFKSGQVADGEGSTSAKSVRGSMKLPSFRCLEPKGDETCLVSAESSRPPV